MAISFGGRYFLQHCSLEVGFRFQYAYEFPFWNIKFHTKNLQ